MVRARHEHERLNGRLELKNWGILSQVFRHHIFLHCHLYVFRACAVVTQITIENGEPLFRVEFEDL